MKATGLTEVYAPIGVHLVWRGIDFLTWKEMYVYCTVQRGRQPHTAKDYSRVCTE
jgi:hypothetical protein